MRPLLRSAAASLALAASLWMGAAASPPPAAAETQAVVSLELSTLAPPSIVEALHDGASDDWLASLFPAFTPEQREQIRVMAVERTPRGVRVRIELKEDVSETAAYRAPVEAGLTQLAQSLPRPYSYTMKEAKPPREAPRFSWSWSWFRWSWLLGIAGLGALLLILLLRRRPAFLSQPRFGGIPMAGYLPAGLGMGGKFLELQSAPCQTMGVMIREMALRALARETAAPARETHMLAIASAGEPAATAVVTAALGIALVRDGHRVLVVDFMGDDSVLSEVLEEADDEQDLLGTGDLAALRHTGIPDLDLMTSRHLPGNLGPEDAEPLFPRSLTANFDWTLVVLPPGTFVPGLPTFPVFSGPTPRLAVWLTRLEAWRQKARLQGAVLVGVPVSSEIRERMQARSYFEKIRNLEKVAP